MLYILLSWLVIDSSDSSYSKYRYKDLPYRVGDQVLLIIDMSLSCFLIDNAAQLSSFHRRLSFPASYPNHSTIFLSVYSLRCLPQLLGLLSSSFNANSFVVWLFPTRRRNAWKRRSPPQGRAEQGAVAVAGAGAKPEAPKLKLRPLSAEAETKDVAGWQSVLHSFIAFYLDSSLADSSVWLYEQVRVCHILYVVFFCFS